MGPYLHSPDLLNTCRHALECRPAYGRGFDALRLLDLEPPASTHLLRGRLKGNLEYAVLERRLGAVANRPLGQRDRAVEAPVASLVAVPPLALLFALLLAFTL